MKFGDLEIFIVSDGCCRLDGGAMFGVVPKTLWERRLPADERNRITLGLNSLLIRSGKQTILVETGVGNKLSAKWEDIYGVDHTRDLLGSLRNRGVAPEEVDIVVDTHLHFDHCGGNTRREKDGRVAATFPRAHYYVQRGEYEHALAPSERDQASYLRENFDAVTAGEQWVLLDGDQEIAPGITLARVPGHTRDMQCVRLSSGGRNAIFFADLVPTTAHLPYPWVMGYDLYPMTTLEQKRRWIPEAVRGEWLCIFVHDANVPAAYLREKEGRVVAEAYRPTDLVGD